MKERDQHEVCKKAGLNGSPVGLVAVLLPAKVLRVGCRGVTPCLIGIVPYAGLDITAFELMKDSLIERYGGLPPPYMLLACGMLSSSGAQSFAYPFGLIRTRLQVFVRGAQIPFPITEAVYH